ncbi:hypothetical protein Tco_0247895, partial [Tanacetum coccineum]
MQVVKLCLNKKKDFVDKETYDKLCKCFTTLEKHCITLEADSQLNQEIFQQENSVLNQNAPSFTQLFELSELRAQSQAKDTVIVKLKEKIKSLKGNVDESIVKMDMDEIETLNIKLEHIVGNACPLTRITTTNEVPSRKPIVLDSESPKIVVKLVYSRKPRKNKNTESVSKTKVVQIVLWYLDSGCSKHMTGDRSQLTNFISKFLGTVKFRNDQVAKIMGYGDYQIENVTISR